MRRTIQEKMFDGLVHNAVDFLLNAAKELGQNPKFSLLHFCAGIEMILKARLMHEHWALILDDVGKANWDRFKQAEFYSVSPKDAIQRLDNITPHKIPSEAADAVAEVVNARNKLAHFYHEDFMPLKKKSQKLPGSAHSRSHGKTSKPATKDPKEEKRRKVAAMQCRAWHHIYEMTRKQWKSVFDGHSRQLRDVQDAMLKNNQYLSERYDNLKPDLENVKKKGIEVRLCKACCFNAAVVEEVKYGLHETQCRVCESWGSFLRIGCPADKCSGDVVIEDDSGVCTKCKHVVERSSLLDILDENNPFDDPDHLSLIYCQECVYAGKTAVLMPDDDYFCISCYAIEKSLSICGFCSERYTGHLSDDTYSTGCELCDGALGWRED